MRALIEGVLRPAMAAVMAIVVANCNDGCASPSDKYPDLEKAYNLELGSCVAQAPDLEASKACRKLVDTKWGVCDHPEWKLGRCN